MPGHDEKTQSVRNIYGEIDTLRATWTSYQFMKNKLKKAKDW